jgi:hypothetical protein
MTGTSCARDDMHAASARNKIAKRNLVFTWLIFL